MCSGDIYEEIEIKVAQRLRRHMGNPRFRALSERLEALKERHERAQIHSIEFVKQLLQLAQDLLEAEKETPPQEDEDRGKAALTELFEQARSPDTPVVVERIVADIDETVRLVRFPGWQNTTAGEREECAATTPSDVLGQRPVEARMLSPSAVAASPRLSGK